MQLRFDNIMQIQQAILKLSMSANRELTVRQGSVSIAKSWSLPLPGIPAYPICFW